MGVSIAISPVHSKQAAVLLAGLSIFLVGLSVPRGSVSSKEFRERNPASLQICQASPKDFCTSKVHTVAAYQDTSMCSARAKLAYKIAIAHPELLQHLFSWVGDDLTDGHECLLDSFTTDYAVCDPSIQDEAILAEALWKKKLPLSEIQRQVDLQFQRYYPFDQDSPALKRYKAARLYR